MAEKTQVLLIAGSGGAGRTTVAEATGLAASRRGQRTLVLSFDASRDLSGAFGVVAPTLAEARGLPVRVEDSLHLQELDVASELKRRWSDGRGEVAALLGGGLEGVTAEEVALTPGVEVLLALLLLGEYSRARTYDLIVIDAGDALRFVGGADSVGWYARRSRAPEQGARRARPSRVNPEVLHAVSDQLTDVGALLRDPTVTRARWVTTHDHRTEQSVRRACAAFGLQGLALDGIILNRLALVGEDAALARHPAVENLQHLVGAIPVTGIALQGRDIVGEEALEAFATQLYRGEDPARLGSTPPGLGVGKQAVDVYRLEVQLPFARKEEVSLSRREAELVIQVGAFRRNVLLPRMLAPLATAGASLEGDRLVVEFKKERV
ncbi:arsenite efflux ATP-binding protein ArsA [Myxococcus fulvus]|uniref:arsenite-transporting ATPase n=1 Tax=Myxococcus fulvus TaxID=33 RepID=A0A511T8V1_MYXFU|nr:ArsA-related P-loop ATPase [Myxococcus fulvus]GEN10596.1 arsenic-transporting ATPase [Myxococcus fulvus]SET79046.1 arsenite efflux ATP-binding protein ArsA [Myxococcus fulvus]